MTAPPTRLLSAVLQSLSEVGPCPTAFRASPGADYVCNGKPMQAGPGWWVAFACQLQIVSVSDAGTSDEVVVLRFQGDRVHRGEAFSWELATTTDQLGQRRLLLEDTATYPDPLLNILAYRAIAECRDMLLQRTALRLGQILPEKPGLKTVVTGVLAALGWMRGGGRSASAVPFPYSAADAPPPEEYMDRYPYSRNPPPHVQVPPRQPPAVYKMLDETPRASATSRAVASAAASAVDAVADNLLPILGLSRAGSKAPTARSRAGEGGASAPGPAAPSLSAAEAFFLRSAAAADEAAAYVPPPAARPADGSSSDLLPPEALTGGPPLGAAGSQGPQAELFGISQYLHSQPPTDWDFQLLSPGGTERTSAGGEQEAWPATLAQPQIPSLAAAVDEAEIDSMRARHPDRSTESLRHLIKSQQRF